MRERVDGGTKSHGRTTKSDWMREEKCRRRVHVPTARSCDSSYVWRSILRVGKDEESDWM